MSKITLVMTSDGYHDRRMMRIRTSLIQAGYDVSVIARKVGYLDAEEKDSSFYLIQTSAQSGPLMYYQFNQQAYKRLCTETPDLVYAVDLDTLWGVYRVHKKRGVPFVFDAHEYYTETPELNGKAIKKWIWTRLGKMAIPSAASRWTVTATIAERLKEKYSCTFSLVRNMPDKSNTEINRPNLDRKLNLVYLGVLNKGRGLEEIIRAMATRPAVHLDLLGRGDIELELKALIQDLGIANRCIMHGWVSQKDHQQFMNRAHYGVNLLSALSESYRLSLANKFFDYVHAGLPALQMDYPEYRAMTEKHRVAVLVPELRVKTVGDILDKLLVNKELYRETSRACLRAREDWTWESESSVLLKEIKRVI